jgi:hypothetical protein
VLVMSKVVYRPASCSPTRPCVWCAKDATQEAVQSEGNMTVISRCCDDPKCMWRSEEMCERTVAD